MLCHWFNISRLLHQFQVCNPAHLWFCKTKGCKRPKCFPITATLLLFLLNCFECVRVCVGGGSHIIFILNYSIWYMHLHLTADLGIEPYSRELRPLYNPLSPWSCTVSFTQSPVSTQHAHEWVDQHKTNFTCMSQWPTNPSVSRRVYSCI